MQLAGADILGRWIGIELTLLDYTSGTEAIKREASDFAEPFRELV